MYNISQLTLTEIQDHNSMNYFISTSYKIGYENPE